MLNTAVAQLVGFLRTALIAAFLGASIDVDAYYLSVLVPSFVSTVAVNWLQVGFVGRYAGLVAVGDREATKAYRSRMLLLLCSAALVATVACSWQADRILRVLLSDEQHLTTTAAAGALKLCSLILMPILVAEFLALILNCHGRFFVASAAPAANAAVSVLALWLWPTIDLPALLWTLILGSFVQLTVVVVALAAAKLDFGLVARFAPGEVRAAALTAMPLLPAILLTNAVTAVLQIRSAELGEGAVAILNYAQRLHGALTQILIIGVGTVLLPHAAALWARNEKVRIIELLRRIARACVLVCGFLLGGVYLLGDATVGSLFVRGSFDSELAGRVAEVWFILTLSLLPFALGTFVSKVAQATGRPMVILLSSVLLFASTWGASLWGSRAQSLEMIAFAPTVAFATTGLFWLVWLKRAVGPSLVWRDLISGALRALPVVALAVVVDLVFRDFVHEIPVLASLILRGAVYSLVFTGLVYSLGTIRWFFAAAPSAPPVRPMLREQSVGNCAHPNRALESDP